MLSFVRHAGHALLAVALLHVLFLTPPAQAQIYNELYSFFGRHGIYPYGGLIRGKSGALYGTTGGGGAYHEGTVFRLKANGKETVLHSFAATDGAGPYSGVIMDTAGNIYGTTVNGGSFSSGVVFRLDTVGVFSVLYSFTGGADGFNPFAGLVRDGLGNLYGTTQEGGDSTCHPIAGCGTIYKLDTTGSLTVLHAFSGADGEFPQTGGALAQDASGNLYGTTTNGGNLDACNGVGCGVVFKLDTNGTYTVLYRFEGGSAGAYPDSGVILDKKGRLYGTTEVGGDLNLCNGGGCGVVFKLNTNGTYAVLHTFKAGSDGAFPGGALLHTAASLFGTTREGGDLSACNGLGCGVVFQLDVGGKYTVLRSFIGGTDGVEPLSGVIRDGEGNLYGTTLQGGVGKYCRNRGCGTIFKIAP
jgi:uncharacterized repeat protein (TIGR03803 family)